MADESTQFLSVREFARRQGVSPFSVAKAVRRGQLPHARLGRRVLVPVDAFERITRTGAMAADAPKVGAHVAA